METSSLWPWLCGFLLRPQLGTGERAVPFNGRPGSRRLPPAPELLLRPAGCPAAPAVEAPRVDAWAPRSRACQASGSVASRDGHTAQGHLVPWHSPGLPSERDGGAHTHSPTRGRVRAGGAEPGGRRGRSTRALRVRRSAVGLPWPHLRRLRVLQIRLRSGPGSCRV